MTKDEALDRLEEADLAPALYRTARRILDRVSEAAGDCWLDAPTMRWICKTDSDETVRGHLSRLAATGLIRRVAANGTVHIQWCDWDGDEEASQRAEIARQRAESARQEAQERAESARQRAESARQEADQRAESARQRAEIAQKRADSARCEDENEEPVYIVTTTNVVVVKDNDNNNCDSSSSSSAPTAPAVTEPQQPEPQQPALPAAIAPAVAAIDPADWARVRAVYESDFGLFTSLLVERVQDALRQHSAEMVILAMGRAVSANKRRWDYVEGILRNWTVEGYGNAGAKNAAVGTAAESRGAGRSGGAAGATSAGRQEAPAPEGLREWLIATGQVPAFQGAD